jgi:RNA-directed DNA polymerase
MGIAVYRKAPRFHRCYRICTCDGSYWRGIGGDMSVQFGGIIVTYADDLVICCTRQADQALDRMRQIMQRLKLTVNEEKTHLCRVPAGHFDFLGYQFGRCYSTHTGRAYLGTRPSRKSIRRLIGKIHEQTDRKMCFLDEADMVNRLNRMLRGWANYFCLGPVSKAYGNIDRYTNKRLRRWLCRKHRIGNGGYTRFSAEYLYQHLGLINLPTLTRNFPWART